MAKRNAFPLNDVHPHGSRIEQDIHYMVIQ